MNDDREELLNQLEKPLNAFKPGIVGGNGKNPNLYAPWDFSGDYVRKCFREAPLEIKSAVQAFFQDTNEDGGDGIQAALDEAYKARLSSNVPIFDPAVEGEQRMPKDLSKIPSTKEHADGLDNMKKASKYIAKILKNAKRSDMRFDEDGNERV